VARGKHCTLACRDMKCKSNGNKHERNCPGNIKKREGKNAGSLERRKERLLSTTNERRERNIRRENTLAATLYHTNSLAPENVHKICNATKRGLTGLRVGQKGRRPFQKNKSIAETGLGDLVIREAERAARLSPRWRRLECISGKQEAED